MVTFAEQLPGLVALAIIIPCLGMMLAVYCLEIVLKCYIRFKIWQSDRELDRLERAPFTSILVFDKYSGTLQRLSSNHEQRIRGSRNA
jgi:hypothetical protein